MRKKATLHNLNPLISLLPSALSTAPTDELLRTKSQPGAWWYRTSAWQKLREFVFLRDHCQCFECHHVFDKDQLVAHHKRPHQGDRKLFWDLENLTTCCKGCHDGVVQARELEAKAKGYFFD